MIKKMLSIIVPVYNVEKYLDECVRSILRQTYPYIEIILVDDGSSDNSGIICDEWAKKYNNIIVVHQLNSGVSTARNRGLEQIHGEFVTFVDADDYLSETIYEKAINKLNKTEADIVVFGYYEKYESELKEKIPFIKDVLYKDEAIHDFISAKGWQLFVWNKIFKSSILLDTSNKYINYPIDVFIGEDAFWLLRVVLNSNKIGCVNASGYYYRKNRINSAVNKSYGTQRIESCRSRALASKRSYDLLLENHSQHAWMMYRRYVFSIKDIVCESYLRGKFDILKDSIKELKNSIKTYKRIAEGDRWFIYKCTFLSCMIQCHLPKEMVKKVMKL